MPHVVAEFVVLAATLSGAPFGPPTDVSRSGSNCFVPSIAVERAGPGAFLVFWHDFPVLTPGVPVIGCVANDGVSYGAPGVCLPTANARFPRAATDSLGRTHIVWRETDPGGQREIAYALWDGAAWSAPINLSNTPGQSNFASLAIGPQDRVYVLWEEDTGGGAISFYETEFDGLAWSTPVDSGIAYGGAAVDRLKIAVDSTGTLHAVWEDTLGAFAEVFHSERPSGMGWSVPENLSNTPQEDSNEPAIAVGPGDVLHVVWAEQEAATGLSWEVVHARRLPAVGWVPADPLSSLGAIAVRPAVAVGSDDGEARVAWTLFAEKEVMWVQVPALGPVGTPVNVSDSPGADSERVSIGLDAAGESYLAWQERGATREIFVATTRPLPVSLVLKMTADRTTGDAILTWAGGAPAYHVDRAEGSPVGVPIELTPVGGIGVQTWTDTGVVGDAFSYYYQVR